MKFATEAAYWLTIWFLWWQITTRMGVASWEMGFLTLAMLGAGRWASYVFRSEWER